MKPVKLLSVCLIAAALLMPAVVSAQEPTDRPFPATAAPTDRPFPATAAPTDRPFPATAAPTTVPVEAAASPEAVSTDTSGTEPELSAADLEATSAAALLRIAELEAERTTLLTELDAAQSDNGATTFALVIVVVGVLLAAAVFFGLRRSAE